MNKDLFVNCEHHPNMKDHYRTCASIDSNSFTRLGRFEMPSDAYCTCNSTDLNSLMLLCYLQILMKFSAFDPIKKVLFRDPATIVFWSDGTKTVVKASNEVYDPEKGLAMAISKKFLGNGGNYYNEFKKWLPTQETEES